MADVTASQVLLQRAQGGDDAALNELYGRYVPRVLAAVRVRLGAELRKKVESWDVVQEAMLASLKNVDSFEQQTEGAFLKWLTQIVENRIRDQVDFHHAHRRDHRRDVPCENARSGEPAIPLEIPDARGLPTPSQMLVLTEELARLEQAMDRLPPDARELIVAVKLEGRTYDELAVESGKSPDATRMQVNRAMALLTKAFRELEECT